MPATKSKTTGKSAVILPTLHFATREDWEDWLETNHATSPGIWVKLAKKGSGVDSVTQPEALDAALCFGWIDGQANRCEDPFWLQKYTPRTARSRWTKKNCGKAETLLAEGRMRPAGLRAMEAAKADGRWERAYDSPRNITVPADLQQKLEEDPTARDFFVKLSGQNRYAILHRIHDAKKPETRARRIEKFVTMLREGKTIY